MSPVTHFLTGWALANVARLDRRERALVTAAAVIPDMDGLGVVPELLTRRTSHPLLWFSEYHHALHTLLFAVVVTAAAVILLKSPPLPRKDGSSSDSILATAALVFIAFHVHLLEDILGSRGPDGYAWPVPYLKPFSNWTWTWSGQWGLNAWPNVAITCVLIALMMWIAVKNGRTPLEFVSRSADEAAVEAMRGWFRNKRESAGKSMG